MRNLLLIGFFLLSLSGCALENTYGVPYRAWSQLTPEQRKALADYDQKDRGKEKKNWIWKDAAEQPK